jgi:2-polyprenyl-3-methyl-5-hydroxy-6-metoxy-1,4-benzoquinol methylase
MLGPDNKTQLDIEKATERGLIHRDYIAHCLRWNHVLKFARRGDSILDLGCGDGMLAQILFVNKFRPKQYVGLDVRKTAIEKLMSRKVNFPVTGIVNDIRIGSIGDAASDFLEKFDVVVCFEIIEHFEDKYLDHVLQEIYRVLKPSGYLLLSTPNYDGVHKARNHVHEYYEVELGMHLEKVFSSIWKIGTFASQKDILSVLTWSERELFDNLSKWFDSNVLSVIFASLHPSQSRNILWVCRKEGQ